MWMLKKYKQIILNKNRMLCYVAIIMFTQEKHPYQAHLIFYFERNKEFLGVLFCTNNIERENTTRSTKAAAG